MPTAPVLSQLLTAAPSGFLSQIVHDPSYARSFEDDFAAGSSPSWFLDLPSSVRDYLHTYGGYEGVASQVISAESVIIKASAEGQNGLGQIGGNRTVTAKTTDTGDGESSTTTQRGLSAGILTDSSTSAASSTVASSSSQAGAANAKESGVFAVGAMAMAGILGVAVAL